MAVQLTTARQAAVSQGIKLLVHGPAGSGKTVLATTCPGSPIILSAESGLLSIRGSDIPVIVIDSLGTLLEAYQYVSDGDGVEYNWVVLDSISEIAEQVLTREKELAGKDPRKAYGELADKMMSMLRSFRDLPGRNVYMSAKQERVEDESGRKLYQPMMPGQRLGQQLPYLFDEVFALRVERTEDGELERWLQTASDTRHVAKDRSGALDLYERPDISSVATKILAGASTPARED